MAVLNPTNVAKNLAVDSLTINTLGSAQNPPFIIAIELGQVPPNQNSGLRFDSLNTAMAFIIRGVDVMKFGYNQFSPTHANGIIADLGGPFFDWGTLYNRNIHCTGLKVFANNAAAIAGGLAAGDFYRTGNDPDVVCVVH